MTTQPTRVVEFFCPYCGDFIREDLVHDENHHNGYDEPDRRRVCLWRYSVDGGKTWTKTENTDEVWPVPASALGDYALIETMPDCWRELHREAKNWGRFPGNNAVREWMPTSDALQRIKDDPDKYAHIVRTSDEEPA